jgi:hypothetical protein
MTDEIESLLRRWPFSPSALEIPIDEIFVLDTLPVAETPTAKELFSYLTSVKPDTLSVQYAHTPDIKTLKATLATLAAAAGGRAIALHIEAHGCDAGLGVGEAQEFLSWKSLADDLRPLCRATEMNLVLYVAACEGIRSIQTLTIVEATPFLWITGPQDPLFPSEVLEGAKTYYGELFATKQVSSARDACRQRLRKGSSPESLHAAVLVLRGIEKYLRNESSDSAIEARVERLSRQENMKLTPEAKEKVEHMIRTTAPEHIRKIWARVWRWSDVAGAMERFPFDAGAISSFAEEVRSISK